MEIGREFALYVEAAGGVVAKVATLKKFIDYMSLMGYNKFYLGCADTFEIKEEPYFGYKRGRYTVEEIKEILTEKSVDFATTVYSSTKSHTLICSKDLTFLTSL